MDSWPHLPFWLGGLWAFGAFSLPPSPSSWILFCSSPWGPPQAPPRGPQWAGLSLLHCCLGRRRLPRAPGLGNSALPRTAAAAHFPRGSTVPSNPAHPAPSSSPAAPASLPAPASGAPLPGRPGWNLQPPRLRPSLPAPCHRASLPCALAQSPPV